MSDKNNGLDTATATASPSILKRLKSWDDMILLSRNGKAPFQGISQVRDRYQISARFFAVLVEKGFLKKTGRVYTMPNPEKLTVQQVKEIMRIEGDPGRNVPGKQLELSEGDNAPGNMGAGFPKRRHRRGGEVTPRAVAMVSRLNRILLDHGVKDLEGCAEALMAGFPNMMK